MGNRSFRYKKLREEFEILSPFSINFFILTGLRCHFLQSQLFLPSFLH